jgi:recombinational DNA repair ATPase RecF
MIAARWAKVDDETKKYCKMMAAAELKYKEELERLSTIGEIPEDMKERMIKKQRKKEKKRGTTYTGPDDYVVI